MKLSPLVSAGILLNTSFLQGFPLIAPRFWEPLPRVWILSIVPLSFPQGSMAGQCAWWEMTGMSPHHYFLIHFWRATRSGKQLTHLWLFRSLRIFMASAVTKTNQVCISPNFSYYFSKALPTKHATELHNNRSNFSFSFYFTALFSEAWRDELKELAAKVSLTSQAQKDKKEVLVQ